MDLVQTHAETRGCAAAPAHHNSLRHPAADADVQHPEQPSLPGEVDSAPNNWVKGHWMRAGSAPHTTFAGEQVIDELAHAAKMDPVAFRIQNVVQGNDWLGPAPRRAARAAERGHAGTEAGSRK